MLDKIIMILFVIGITVAVIFAGYVSYEAHTELYNRYIQENIWLIIFFVAIVIGLPLGWFYFN